MQLSQTPPTRKSILQTGVVNPLGPYQRMNCSGSAQAFQTSSRGASNMRSMTSACCSDSAAGLLASAILVLLLRNLTAEPLLLCLKLLQIAIKSVEALLPVPPVALD